MGWKSVKEYYQIKHIVQVVDGNILIGSEYVPNIIKITKDADVEWGPIGDLKEHSIGQLYTHLTSNKTKLKELIDTKDEFVDSKIIYSFNLNGVYDTLTEKVGFPNVTNDGELQYGDMFFDNPQDAKKCLKSSLNDMAYYNEREINRIEHELISKKLELTRFNNLLSGLND